MASRTEQIMAALLTIVSGTTTAGANAERDRDAPKDGVNCLSVEQGDDEPVEIQGNILVHKLLNVSVVVWVKKNNTYSTEINKIINEIYVAVMADRELGLPDFVGDILPTGVSKPEPYEAGTTLMKAVINFEVMYQHSLTDMSA